MDPGFFDAHANMVIPEGWLCLIHPAINLLPTAQILSFPPRRPQQSKENHSVNCLAVAGAAWQGGAALLRQTRAINASLRAERIRAVCSEAGKCMHACNRQLIIPMTAAGGAGKGVPSAPPGPRLPVTPAGAALSPRLPPNEGCLRTRAASEPGLPLNEGFLLCVLVFTATSHVLP